ncbi:hypothetical protein NXX54_19040 [Bacteroides sp. BFG-638]|nr:hypothetical protein [Bacteroides sp. BFG-638]MCS3313930.1 hypothetical protein [Bacteroides sp. BFG-637]
MEKINLYVAVEQMEADYHFRGYLFYQVPEMEPSDAGRRRHGDTYCRPFEEKGDG